MQRQGRVTAQEREVKGVRREGSWRRGEGQGAVGTFRPAHARALGKGEERGSSRENRFPVGPRAARRAGAAKKERRKKKKKETEDEKGMRKNMKETEENREESLH